jgi:hypothetical protein
MAVLCPQSTAQPFDSGMGFRLTRRSPSSAANWSKAGDLSKCLRPQMEACGPGRTSFSSSSATDGLRLPFANAQRSRRT